MLFLRVLTDEISHISTETQFYFDIKLVQTKLDKVKENIAKMKTPI